MADAGILTPEDRLELIEGEIFRMSPIGRRHAACVRRLLRLFSQRLSNRALVDAQNPVVLNDASEPQPDLALLQLCADFYENGHPQPQEVFLVVEVADTTIEYDREVKIPAYARAGISEVWLFDINQQCLEVRRQPFGDKYLDEQKYQRGTTVFLQAFPDVSFTLDEILGL